MASVKLRLLRNLEWPTLAVAAIVYSGFGALIFSYPSLPIWLSLPLGGILLTWYGSLRHELVHQRPTPWRFVNSAMGFVPLSLYLPFLLYVEEHRRHHQTPELTDPIADPESFYRTMAAWQALPAWQRWIAKAHLTLVGRLLLGPALYQWLCLKRCLADLAAGGQARMRWLQHLMAAALVIYMVCGLAGLPFWLYYLMIYCGDALTLLRSFAEHRAAAAGDADAGDSAIVLSGPFFSLLYLNNNLHAAHHAAPSVAWYRLPAFLRAHPELLAHARAKQICFNGYREIARRFAFAPVIAAVHPRWLKTN